MSFAFHRVGVQSSIVFGEPDMPPSLDIEMSATIPLVLKDLMNAVRITKARIGKSNLALIDIALAVIDTGTSLMEVPAGVL